MKSVPVHAIFEISGEFSYHAAILGSLRVHLLIAVEARPDTLLLRQLVTALVGGGKIIIPLADAKSRPAHELRNSRGVHLVAATLFGKGVEARHDVLRHSAFLVVVGEVERLHIVESEGSTRLHGARSGIARDALNVVLVEALLCKCLQRTRLLALPEPAGRARRRC